MSLMHSAQLVIPALNYHPLLKIVQYINQRENHCYFHCGQIESILILQKYVHQELCIDSAQMIPDASCDSNEMIESNHILVCYFVRLYYQDRSHSFLCLAAIIIHLIMKVEAFLEFKSWTFSDCHSLLHQSKELEIYSFVFWIGTNPR